MDIGYVLGRVIFGSVIVIYGLWTLEYGTARVGFGRPPSWITSIDDGCLTKVLGIGLVIGGLLFASPILAVIFNSEGLSNVLQRLPFFGLLLVFCTILVTMILQRAIMFGEWLHNKSLIEKSKNQDNENK